MVQSLVPICEEQQKRTGIQETTMRSDHCKPLPEDVTELFSVGLDFEKKIIELCSEAEASLFCTPPGKELRFVCSYSHTMENLLNFAHVKHNNAADKEAQNLLKWLATSQAAEDKTLMMNLFMKQS
uniref:Uncharacterized protein n=1 Tax=Cajanus cajan TaxID=3821 RepID=A0A151T411_CAJCA|nr:hypothetical protein KK1_016266 [Cajanus cajan]KYP61758.1 hypothetical protein KK1_016268 [Cajanus cajan]